MWIRGSREKGMATTAAAALYTMRINKRKTKAKASKRPKK
jgi:hypothetical protein